MVNFQLRSFNERFREAGDNPQDVIRSATNAWQCMHAPNPTFVYCKRTTCSYSATSRNSVTHYIYYCYLGREQEKFFAQVKAIVQPAR